MIEWAKPGITIDGKRSFVCLCGHLISEHVLRRDPTPSAPNFYEWVWCTHKGCKCERAQNEAGTIF
jgi:hypothetical protein